MTPDPHSDETAKGTAWRATPFEWALVAEAEQRVMCPECGRVGVRLDEMLCPYCQRVIVAPR